MEWKWSRNHNLVKRFRPKLHKNPLKLLWQIKFSVFVFGKEHRYCQPSLNAKAQVQPSPFSSLSSPFLEVKWQMKSFRLDILALFSLTFELFLYDNNQKNLAKLFVSSLGVVIQDRKSLTNLFKKLLWSYSAFLESDLYHHCYI